MNKITIIQKWEYMLLNKLSNDRFTSDIQNIFNDLGNKGWELVIYNDVNEHFIFKRPKPEEKPEICHS